MPPNTRVTNQLISHTDLYRTVCTLAGVMVPDDQALDSYDFSQLITAPQEQSQNVVRDFMAIQAPVLADSTTASKKRKMGWSFYSYDPNGEILNAIMNLSKRSKDFEDAAMDELYLLTSDEDQSEDIRSSHSDLMDVLESKFTTFLNKNATHSGQLATPEKAVNWQDFVTSE